MTRGLFVAGHLQPEWESLILEHPDRFVLGADEFLGEPMPGRPAGMLGRTWDLISMLPADVARQLACDNPARVYRLP